MPANVMFCLVQYRVRPGEKCEFTTKSTKVTKRILAPARLFVARQPSQFFSDGGPSRFPNPSRDAGCEDIHAGRRPSAGSDHTKPACLGRFSSFRSFCVFVPFVAIPGKDPAAAFCKRLIALSPWFAAAAGPLGAGCFPSDSAPLQPRRFLYNSLFEQTSGRTLGRYQWRLRGARSGSSL